MALVNCPECGRKGVSSTADACPGCGYNLKKHFSNDPGKKPSKRPNPLIIVVVALWVCLIAVSIILAVSYSNGSADAPESASQVTSAISSYEVSEGTSEVETAKHTHTYITIDRKRVTCTEAGYHIVGCRYCDYEEKTTTPALGHTDGEICERCDKILVPSKTPYEDIKPMPIF